MSDAPNHDHLGDEDLAAYAAVLEEVRVELEHRADLVRDGADVPTAGLSFGTSIGNGVDRFEDVAIHGQAALQLTAVEQALARIDEGTFGICPGCNRAIPIDRLNVLPWAATCVACA